MKIRLRKIHLLSVANRVHESLKSTFKQLPTFIHDNSNTTKAVSHIYGAHKCQSRSYDCMLLVLLLTVTVVITAVIINKKYKTIYQIKLKPFFFHLWVIL